MKRASHFCAFALLLVLSSGPAHSASPSARFAAELSAGPDVVVGDVSSLAQLGASGTQVGLAAGVLVCNNGDTVLNFSALPSADHVVLGQNLYRMSGGVTNDDRFEQVGQSWLLHTFAVLEQNSCGLGCIPSGLGGVSHLGAGCSYPESAGINGSQNVLGSRPWVNPFTGVFPGSNPSPADHSSHTHTGTAHRLFVEASDLTTTGNPGATYYLEVQCVSPNEYAWCQSHPGQCNMYNNASYRQFNVVGTTTFTFSALGSAVRMARATDVWPGATSSTIEPEPGIDGRAFVLCKVTHPSAEVWHYEYAVHNQNLDRAIQSFSVPLGCGITVSNPGFHAPPQHPGFANDGTQNNAGFSSAPWISNQTPNTLTWNCENFLQNPNANAIRWGTLYNFRFDSNRPPQAANATIGFFKTGASVLAQIQAPAPDPCAPLQIVNVVSRKTHGSAGDFDISLPLSGSPGVECRGTGGNHTFVFTFTNNIVSGNATVTAGTGTLSGNPSLSGNTMTVTLTGVADRQNITVLATGVTDTFGQILPDTVVTAGILAGDANQNRAVNSSDIAMTKAQLGQSVTGSNFTADVNANGVINAADVSMVKANVGNALP